MHEEENFFLKRGMIHKKNVSDSDTKMITRRDLICFYELIFYAIMM